MAYTKNLDSFPAAYHMLLGKMQAGVDRIELHDLPLGLALDTRRKFYGFRTALLLDAEKRAKAKDALAEARKRDYDLAMRFAVEVNCPAKPRTAWTKLVSQDIVTLRFILKDAQEGNELLMQKLSALSAPPSLDDILAGGSPTAALDSVISDIFGSKPPTTG